MKKFLRKLRKWFKHLIFKKEDKTTIGYSGWHTTPEITFPGNIVGKTLGYQKTPDNRLIQMNGTGVVYGTSCIITCAHCIGTIENGNFKLFDDLRFILPSRTGPDRTFYLSEYWIPKGWDGEQRQFDTAILRLKDDKYGVPPGWNDGYWKWISLSGNFNSEREKTTNVYGWGKLSKNQSLKLLKQNVLGPSYSVQGTVRTLKAEFLTGPSGGPWMQTDQDGNPHMVGIQTSGADTPRIKEIVSPIFTKTVLDFLNKNITYNVGLGWVMLFTSSEGTDGNKLYARGNHSLLFMVDNNVNELTEYPDTARLNADGTDDEMGSSIPIIMAYLPFDYSVEVFEYPNYQGKSYLIGGNDRLSITNLKFNLGDSLGSFKWVQNPTTNISPVAIEATVPLWCMMFDTVSEVTKFTGRHKVFDDEKNGGYPSFTLIKADNGVNEINDRFSGGYFAKWKFNGKTRIPVVYTNVNFEGKRIQLDQEGVSKGLVGIYHFPEGNGTLEIWSFSFRSTDFNDTISSLRFETI